MKRPVIYLASAAMLLSPLAAHSADVAVTAPPPPPVPVFSWTGFYVGANVGGAWSNNRWTDTVFLSNFNNASNGVHTFTATDTDANGSSDPSAAFAVTVSVHRQHNQLTQAVAAMDTTAASINPTPVPAPSDVPLQLTSPLA